MARWLIDIAGVQLTVKAKHGPARDVVELALASMHTSEVKSAHGIKLSVKHNDEGWEVIDHSNNLRHKLTHSGDVIYHLTDRIVFHVADKASDVHCLHAAAVAKGGNALVIPANSGAGKSSFTTWLVANGFEYLTDELILVNEANELDGIGRPIQIKSHGLDAIDHLIEDKSLLQKGRFTTALPVSCLGGVEVAAAQQALTMFVFPKYKAGAEFSFKPLMMALIRNTACYSLEYGGFDTLPGNFSEQLSGLLLADNINQS